MAHKQALPLTDSEIRQIAKEMEERIGLQFTPLTLGTLKEILVRFSLGETLTAATQNAFETQNARLLVVVKAAYLKHHCGQDNVGWEELSDMMCNSLCEVMGDQGFQQWLSENSEGNG